jgi:uracil-DNA glycosylase family 4
MGGLIKDEGSKHAKMVLIGEAPGAQEDAQGRPFVGASGHKLMDWWDDVGLRRMDFYITNVYPYRPEKNNISSVPKGELKEWINKLHERLATIEAPNVLIPTGNTALHALTGKRGITRQRGSILSYMDRRGRVIKVIPTLHPAGLLWSKKSQDERICKLDWRRISEERFSPELGLPSRIHIIHPSDQAVLEFISQVDRNWRANPQDAYLAVDIETPGNRIACVGFSCDPGIAICLPTDQFKDRIKQLLAHPVRKVFQNGHFDMYYLTFEGYPVRNWWWDTMAEHHLLEPGLPHSLDFMASVDTREPFWKLEAKDPDEIAKHTDSVDAFYTYNCKDVAVTGELHLAYVDRIRARGREAFYHQHYRKMFRPLLEMMVQGIRVNRRKRKEMFGEHQNALEILRHQLNEFAGFDLYGPKGGLVPQRVAKLLYDKMSLPKMYNRKTKTRTKAGGLPVTTNEVALRTLQLRFPARVAPVMDNLMAVRRHTKLRDFLKDNLIDSDDRFRSSIRFTTEMGRLASRKNPMRTGGNMQNIDSEIKGTFIPDEDGWLFIEVDLSQAEDRVVKMLTGRPDMIELARKKPWEFDVHSYAASQLFKKPIEFFNSPRTPEATELRDTGKISVHGGNYDMGPETLSDLFLKAGFPKTLEECSKLLTAAKSLYEGAVLEYQSNTRKLVISSGKLTNSWTRELDFSHDRLGDDLYRRAYAFRPQSEVADILNQLGFIPLYAHRKMEGLMCHVNAQVHDSILLSAPPHEIFGLMRFLRESLEQPRLYLGQPMTIPATFKLGRTWKCDHEFKQFPSRDEVEAVIRRLL